MKRVGIVGSREYTNRRKIKEFVFIIVEHSKYSLNHPDNKENILRHLKHTCHAIDPVTVEERPMPAGDEGLINLIRLR